MSSRPAPRDSLDLATAVEGGVRFETGRSVRFTFVRNTAKAPHFGPLYQQDLEPAGRYVLHGHDVDLECLPRGWESGEVELGSPLVVPFNVGPDDRYDETSWKARLASHYGRRGLALSRAILRDGHDGVVTVGSDGRVREIVVLAVGRSARH